MIEKHCFNCFYYERDDDEEPCKNCIVGNKHESWVPKPKPSCVVDQNLQPVPDQPDQTAKSDAGKLDLTLVPLRIIWDIAAVREYGNKKYGSPDNWRNVEIQRYRAAAFRHFLAYLDDPQGVDEESGLKHLWHLCTNCAFLCELEDFDDISRNTITGSKTETNSSS